MFVKSSHHANIAKKLEERNLNIYSTVMVGMAWQYYDTWALIPLPVYLVSEKKKDIAILYADTKSSARRHC